MNSYKSELEKELLSISNTLKEKISNTTNFFDNKICILNRAYEVLETINKFDIFEKVQTEFDKFWFNFIKNSSRTTITRSEIINKLNKIYGNIYKRFHI